MDMLVDTSSAQVPASIMQRLGACEVCNDAQAKYTCPKCEVKTCCLRCLNIHKRELDCNGVRDKTRFIPLRDMTDVDFASDYTFLEECTRYVADRRRDQLKRHTRYNKTLPAHLFKLRAAAQQRRTALRFLLALFSRHAANTTFYDWKTKVIWWRCEWRFPNAGNVTAVDERCDERWTLGRLLAKYVSVQEEEGDIGAEAEADKDGEPSGRLSDAMRKSLTFYRSRGLAQMRVLLKAEGIKRSRTRFWELDVGRTLAENLSGKTIVEFPVIYVMYDDVVKEFDVIDIDEDIDHETELHQLELKNAVERARQAAAAAAADAAESAAAGNTTPQNSNQQPATAGAVVGPHVRELLQQRRREERRAKRARQLANKQPQNLLFVDGHDDEFGDAATAYIADNGSSSDEDGDGHETEEEEFGIVDETDGARVTLKSHIDEDELEYELAGDVGAKRAKLS